MRVSDEPEEGDASLGGSRHAAVVIDGVLRRDVVLQEQTLRILLLQSVPLPGVLKQNINRDVRPAFELFFCYISSL